MCAVIGYYSKKQTKEDKELLSKLVKESKIRGLHSFGYAYKNKKNEIELKKQFTFEVEIPDTNMLIAHGRYSTSGDWNEETNNQPIEYNNNYIAFNGDINMGTKKEMEEEYGIEMSSNNDAEIFLHLSKNMYSEEIIEELNCSFAGIFIIDNEIYCHRNAERPLYRAIIGNSVFIASTRDIFKRCGIDKVKPVKQDKTYKLEHLLDEDRGIQELSYPNDEKWGYRPCLFVPIVSSK